MSLVLRTIACRRGATVLWKSTCTTSSWIQPKIKVKYPPTDPTLSAKFKCHPAIPCDIPVFNEDINALWYHISDDLLPTNWSSNWLEFDRFYWFLPNMYNTYSMGELDIVLKANYGIPYPIKGVMYCTVERVEPGGLFEQQLPPHNHECMVFQDGLGNYYFYYDFSQGGGEYLAKFRAPHGTTVSDFVKHHFRGGVKGVDMDVVEPKAEYGTPYYHILRKEQEDLAGLQKQASAQSCCACWKQTWGQTKQNLRLVE